MKTGLKRTFFPLKMFFPVFAFFIIGTLIYSSFYTTSNEAAANVALFYPANCLGGWKDVDRIAGSPEVRDSTILYSEANSATIKNSNAQVFCGGFAGEIPDTAKHQKVTLNFSWYIGDEEDQVEVKEEENESQMEVIRDTPASPADVPAEAPSEIVTELELSPEAELEPEVVPEESSVGEDVSEPTAFNFSKHFFTIAHAQEQVIEPPVEVKEVIMEEEVIVPLVEPEPEAVNESTPSEEGTVVMPEPEELVTQEEVSIESDSSEGAYFEVLYTLNGQDWYTLGFISRIANDVQIEMPIDLFATVEDLEKVQIALHTVERFDSVPKIFLDALWLEVTYDDIDGGELAPPGTRPGDVIFSETSYQDETAVVVLRNVALMTLSNVLSEAAASTTVSTTTPDAVQGTTTSPTATTSSAVGPALTDFVGTSTLASIINSTGVLVELWLYSSTTDSWSRIADDSIISRNPQVKFESGSVFWVDRNNTSVWRYNPRSGGYDALSFSVDQISKMQFRDEAGELKELDFSSGTSSVQLNDISTSKPTQP